MAGFPASDWWSRFAAALNADAEFGAAARWLDARLEMSSPDARVTLELRGGRAVAVGEGPHPRGSDITLAAPEDEWARLVAGQTDWFRANSPGLGELEVGGDVVMAMRNVLAMSRLLAMMSRVDGEPPAPAPSPDPRPSGAATSGHYVDVDGLRVYYEEAGDGPALVCFHAACQDTLMWRHVLDGLSDEFRVIAIDAPAHAKTLEPAGGAFRDLTRHAEFNERFLELMGIERPAIAGCSMGGNLVLELAARRPDGYAAVISCEGADYTPTVSEFLLEMLLINGQAILDGWSRSLTGDRTPPDRAREVVWQIKRANPEVMAGDLTGYAGFDKREAMGSVTSPVLLLRGDADWLVSQAQVEETAARVADARIAVLAGTGHYPMIENPFEFNETVREFLRAVGVA